MRRGAGLGGGRARGAAAARGRGAAGAGDAETDGGGGAARHERLDRGRDGGAAARGARVVAGRRERGRRGRAGRGDAVCGAAPPGDCHWVRFNRARVGDLREGDAAPDIRLWHLDGAATSLLADRDLSKPLVVVSGSLS